MKRMALGVQQNYGFLLLAMLLMLSASPAWAQDETPTLRSPAGAAGQAAPMISPQQFDTLTCNLWNQPQGSVNIAFPSQDFETEVDPYDIFLADDFISPRPWLIDTVYVPGGLWNGGTTLANAESLHFEIYRDSGGKPDGDPRGGGNPPVWSLAVSPADSRIIIENDTLGTQGNVILELVEPVQLNSGTYWLVFYPRMDFFTFGQYGRFTADTTNRFPAQVMNPGEGYVDPPPVPPTWSNAAVLPDFSPRHDLAFCLQGEEGFYWPMFLPATVK
ncbi:MAG: hypothetical protein SCH71_13650 [Desulfobulbaceae bacterium]|nr:hypothetical protein [Desulfobulbaceae bacterium]